MEEGYRRRVSKKGIEEGYRREGIEERVRKRGKEYQCETRVVRKSESEMNKQKLFERPQLRPNRGGQ